MVKDYELSMNELNKNYLWQVYASPSRRKMDTKGEGEEMTYPHICFMVDNFDEVSAVHTHK